MFTVSQNGQPLPKSKYNWDEKTKTFSTEENNVVVDFGDVEGVMVKTGNSSTVKTGHSSTVKTGYSSTVTTGDSSTVTTGPCSTVKTDGESSLTYSQKIGTNCKLRCQIFSGSVKLNESGEVSKVEEKKQVTLTLTDEQIESLKNQGIM